MHKGAAFGRDYLNATLVRITLSVVRTADQMRCIGERDQESQLSLFEQGAGNAYPYLILKGIAEAGDLYPLRVKGEGTADETFVEVKLLNNVGKLFTLYALQRVQAYTSQVESMRVDPQAIEQCFLPCAVTHIAHTALSCLVLLQPELLIAGNLLARIAVHSPRGHSA